MDKKKINSEEFYQLIKSDNKVEINQLSEVLIQRMTLYIRSVLGAGEETARDCAQEAYSKVYSKIISQDHDKMEDLFAYMIRSSRNEYYMKLRKEKFEVPIDESKYREIADSSESTVIDVLSSDDDQKLLDRCIAKLNKKHRKFFNAVMEYINEEDKVAAEYVGITYGSFRTRKSRIIDMLRECISEQKKKLL
ncbi:MAG: sigma-70 family RNA polymerase sigma factor [Candidatus Paceibacterota bacterium]